MELKSEYEVHDEEVSWSDSGSESSTSCSSTSGSGSSSGGCGPNCPPGQVWSDVEQACVEGPP